MVQVSTGNFSSTFARYANSVCLLIFKSLITDRPPRQLSKKRLPFLIIPFCIRTQYSLIIFGMHTVTGTYTADIFFRNGRPRLYVFSDEQGPSSELVFFRNSIGYRP